jgi:hypothetical protein
MLCDFGCTCFSTDTGSALSFGFTIWKLNDSTNTSEKRRLPIMISENADDRRKPPMD